MRRTYRSKKDAGDGLDHRDVLRNMDEKSSAFDAFYIRNIKQTKREFSSIASSNYVGTSKKVRNKKYVKRIVKAINPLHQIDTLSSSAYLTPDKSIRVNKVLDPFDMLLNSSPMNKECPEHVAVEAYGPKRETKTYVRKKKLKIKKFNYSSTESEKENISDSNVTNIHAHELLIEKATVFSQKKIDDSIHTIVSNLYLLNNFKCKDSNESFNISYKNKNRFMKASQSPDIQKSPLCSTPFKEKYRGVSIFKLSPITQKELESPRQDSDSNHSIILVSKSLAKKLSKEQEKSHLFHVTDASTKNVSDLQASTKNSNPNETKGKVLNEIEFIEDKELQQDDLISKSESSLLQITLTEPFLGFSKNETQDRQSMSENIYVNESKPVIIETNLDTDEGQSTIDSNHTTESVEQSQSSGSESFYDTCNSNQSSIVDEGHKRNHIVEKLNDSKLFKYEDYKRLKSSITDKQQTIREPVVAIERMNDSKFLKYYEKMLSEGNVSDMSEQTINHDFETLSNYIMEEKSCDPLNVDSSCFKIEPDPIVILDSSTTEDIVSNEEDYNDVESEYDNKDDKYVSFVTTRRRHGIIKDSMFMYDQSYSSNSTDCDNIVLSNKVDIDNGTENEPQNYIHDVDVYVLQKDTETDNINNKNNLEKDIRRSSMLSKEGNSVQLDVQKSSASPRTSRLSRRKSPRVSRRSIRSSICNSTQSTSSTHKRISTISTRNSSRLLKRSYSISSESDIDLTVNTNEDNNKTVIENVLEIVCDSKNGDKINNLQHKDARPLLKTVNTLCMLKENADRNVLERFSDVRHDIKPSIVLQPGKKWERSLSIYRRMTMAEHLDHSILEESIQNKGRKYRQSVITTIEMQENKGSLHNDSINSRRSTFVSNSSRPNIRFVKDLNFSRVSLSTSSVFDDLKGFLSEECDDTVIELSKLSIADSEHEVTVIDGFHEVERVTTARDFVLRRCNQPEAILFDECYPETVLKNCHKIGEGVYGEVFLWRGRDGRARVMKVVPIAGTVKVNGEAQKDFHEIISEIVIAMELSALRAPIADIERQLDEGNDIHALDLHTIENATDIFNEVLAVRCVYGPYPSRLLDLWELYDECKGSENDNPAALPTDQCYIVLELANAGQDLESYQFSSAQQAHALFQQIAFGLAVAEEAFQFEHRDLHWGNILIAPTEQKLATFVLRGRTYRVPRRGVAATVIDYSLSRVCLAAGGTAPVQCGAALYNDLAQDEQLFDAVGDYQFQVYRLMRDKLENDWKNFEPYTNILWLHYVVDKMVTALRYKRTNTKIHKHYIEKLTAIYNSILQYGSAVQYVLTDIDF